VPAEGGLASGGGKQAQAAPTLWLCEFRNILAGYMRRKALSFEQADALQREAESLLQGAEFQVDSQAVLARVRDSDCSAYDYEFVALAERLGTRLVTRTRRCQERFRGARWSSPPANRFRVARIPIQNV